jgi:hypothetical protein
MRERYGTHYNYYIEWMEINGILTLVSEYLVGEKCRTWKLTSIIEEPIIRIKNDDKIIVKKYFPTETLPPWISTELRNSLYEDLFKVQIDSEKVNSILEQYDMNSIQYKKNKLACDYIADKNIFNIWDSYGRFHTNFTTLKKSIRNSCLKIDDQNIKELDIKNSQPLFLIKYIKNCSELKLFKTLTYDGTLYDYIAQKYNISRDNVKKLIYTVFFGKNHLNCQSSRIFGELFPNILMQIKNIKKENKDYTYLSKMLQEAESKFIFSLVEEIKNKINNITVFTVHDSIYFQEEYYDQVNTMFIKKLKQLCL